MQTLTWKLLIERRALCVQGLSDRALYEVNPSKLKATNPDEQARIERLREVQHHPARALRGQRDGPCRQKSRGGGKRDPAIHPGHASHGWPPAGTSMPSVMSASM